MSGVVILTSVALPVSYSVTVQSLGSPAMSWALNCVTMGELPEGSAGTGKKSVTLESVESVVMVQV